MSKIESANANVAEANTPVTSTKEEMPRVKKARSSVMAYPPNESAVVAPAENNNGGSSSPIGNRSQWQELKEQAVFAFESGLLPRSIDSRQKAVTIALMGREFDLSPMQSLCGIYVVNGMVALRGSLMLRLIYERVPGARISVLTPPEQADTECTVEMQRPGNKPMIFRFTLDDAKRAGFGNKPIWNQHPSTMLRWAAIRTGARVVFADAIAGCYMEDELPTESAPASNASPITEAKAEETVSVAKPTTEVVGEIGPGSIEDPKPAHEPMAPRYAAATFAKPVTEKQVHRLFAIAHSKNWSRNEVTGWMSRHFQKRDPHGLTRAEYEKVCNYLLSGPARETAGETPQAQ